MGTRGRLAARKSVRSYCGTQGRQEGDRDGEESIRDGEESVIQKMGRRWN